MQKATALTSQPISRPIYSGRFSSIPHARAREHERYAGVPTESALVAARHLVGLFFCGRSKRLKSEGFLRVCQNKRQVNSHRYSIVSRQDDEYGKYVRCLWDMSDAKSIFRWKFKAKELPFAALTWGARRLRHLKLTALSLIVVHNIPPWLL